MFKEFRKVVQKFSQSGFNMLEIVIGVGLILILSAGGVVVYKNITKNAKISQVESAANSVQGVAIAAKYNSASTETLEEIQAGYNSSTKSIKVQLVETDGDICTTATWVKTAEIQASRGKCAGAVVDEEEVVDPPVIETPVEAEKTQNYESRFSVGFTNPALARVDFHLLVKNAESGKVITDQTYTANAQGYANTNFLERFKAAPADVPENSAPYSVVLTMQGKTYEGTIQPSDFVKNVYSPTSFQWSQKILELIDGELVNIPKSK